MHRSKKRGACVERVVREYWNGATNGRGQAELDPNESLPPNNESSVGETCDSNEQKNRTRRNVRKRTFFARTFGA